MAAATEPSPEDRVAALEARALPGPLLRPFDLPPLTREQEAQLRQDFAETTPDSFTHRVIPQPPPLPPGEIRQLLRECVTIVKPGEHLILRVPWNTTPNQVHELQNYVNKAAEYLELPFKILILPGDELGTTEAAP
jgi:hypothetical protein